MELTLTGYSTALFSTWYFVEELGLLFDAGDGVTSTLLQKSRKIKHVFLSHADRDHLTGLLQLNQLNARPGFPVLYYPKDSGSFRALEAFSKQFDRQVGRTSWKPVSPEERIQMRKDLYIQPVRNGHVEAEEGVIRSLSYKVMQTKRKLKPELAHLSPEEIRKLGAEKGQEAVSDEISNCIIGYSGDTPVEDLTRWDNCELLIHEATFLGDGADPDLELHGNNHSMLDQVMEMVSRLNIQKLVLGHFSSRYPAEQITRTIRELCEKHPVKAQVYAVLPGETVADILRRPALNCAE